MMKARRHPTSGPFSLARDQQQSGSRKPRVHRAPSRNTLWQTCEMKRHQGPFPTRQRFGRQAVAWLLVSDKVNARLDIRGPG